MRKHLSIIAMLLPLAGCVVEPAPSPYGNPYGYGGTPAPAYGDDSGVYSGYYYNEGSPYMVVEGAALPLIYFGGAWGYYDGYHTFHRAPDQVWRHLERQNPRGSGIRPYEGRPGGGGYGGAPRGGGGFGGGQAPRPDYRQAPQGGGYGGGGQPQHQGGGGFAAPPQHQGGGGFAAPPQHQGGGGGFAAPPQHQGGGMAAPAAHNPPPQHQGGGGGKSCPPFQPHC